MLKSLAFALAAAVLACIVGLPAALAATVLQDLPPEFDLSCRVSTPTHGSIRMLFDTGTGGTGYTLRAASGGIVLERNSRAGATRLAATEADLADFKIPVPVTVKRRAGRISVLVGHRLLMTVEDNTYSDGSARVEAVRGATALDVRLQPIEPLYFSDDFMRQPDEAGEWNYDKGQWSIQTIGNVERSPNPFSLESRPHPVALASAGYRFWSDYAFEAAAKGSPHTAFGICANLQDDQNYDLLSWSPGPSGMLQLIRVVDGRQTVLAHRSGGFVPGLWYQLGLRTSGSRLIAEVDHQPLMSVTDPTFGEGKIGLFSAGAGEEITWFDSIMVIPSHLTVSNFSGAAAPHWEVESSRAIGGSPTGRNYTVTAEVDPSARSLAIPFHYRDARNFDEMEVSARGVQLISVWKGVRRLLGSSDSGLSPGRAHTVEVAVFEGYCRGAIDGKQVVEGLDLHLGSGRAGFAPLSAGGTTLRSFAIEETRPAEPTDALTAEFTHTDHHVEMGEWAGPLNAWERGPVGQEMGYWHKGSLFGNTVVKIPLVPANFQDSQFAVLLNSDGRSASSGYELDYSTLTGKGIGLTLRRQGVVVASGHIVAPQDTQQETVLAIYRQGSFVYAGVGADMAIQYHDAHPPDGSAILQPMGYAADAGGHSKLGIIVRGATPLDIPNITVTNAHVYAETFHLAPVHWRPQGGTWEVTRRWACRPGWTWYSGRGEGYTVNWHKTPLVGDQSIDYYVAAMMLHPQETGRWEEWRDLNCSFCSDGVNLFSGYTLMVGGWNNTGTRLLRKGKLVAESTDYHFSHGLSAHHLWYDVQIHRQGPHIVATLSYLEEDGRKHDYPLITWDDPQPLPGGFVAFWTYQNGMMVARTVLSAQEWGKTPLYAADPVWVAQEPTDAPYPDLNRPELGLAEYRLPGPDGSPAGSVIRSLAEHPGEAGASAMAPHRDPLANPPAVAGSLSGP